MSDNDVVTTKNGVIQFKAAMMIQALGAALIGILVFIAQDIRSEVKEMGSKLDNVNQRVIRLESAQSK